MKESRPDVFLKKSSCLRHACMAVFMLFAVLGPGALHAESGTTDQCRIITAWEYRYSSESEPPAEGAGWKKAENSVNLPGHDGEPFLWLRTRMPQALPGDAALFMSMPVSGFTVFLDGRKAGGFRKPDTTVDESLGLQNFFIVPLRDGAGAWLSIRMAARGPFIGIAGVTAIGSPHALVERVVRADVLNYAIGLIALLIGLASLLIFAFRPDRREYGYFALFTVCMAIYGIYWTDLKQVVADMPVVYGIGLIFSLHFEAVGILGFLKEILPREFRTATTWLLRANVLYAAIGISLAASRLVPLGYSVIMVNVVIALDILVGLPVIVRAALRGSVDARIAVLGAVALVAISAHDVWATLNAQVIPFKTTAIGFLAFIIILGSILVRRFMQVYRDLRTYTEEIELAHRKGEKQLENFLLVLGSAIESKDVYTGGHVERVAGYSRELAKKLDFSQDDLRDIYLGAIVHDVGKIGVRDAVLNKPGRLDPDEQTHMQYHPVLGKKLLERIEDIRIATDIAYSHQEKWDGSGYPQGLKEDAIPKVARIVTIADYWDAITTDRPYRKAMPLRRAIDIMHEERGKAFDPALFDIFMNEGEKLYLRYVDPEKVEELDSEQ